MNKPKNDSPRSRRGVHRVGVAPTDPELCRRVGPKGHLLWIGGPVPRGADGITVGGCVIVRKSVALGSSSFDELLRHEQVHVAQFRELGALRFLRAYVRSYWRWRLRGYGHWAAYRRIPLEVEARWIAGQAFAETPKPRLLEHTS